MFEFIVFVFGAEKIYSNFNVIFCENFKNNILFLFNKKKEYSFFMFALSNNSIYSNQELSPCGLRPLTPAGATLLFWNFLV